MSRGWRFGLVLVGVLAVAVLLLGNPDNGDEGRPLDPDGTGEFGAKALVLLLEELGAEVEVDQGVPDDPSGTAILLQDRLDEGRRDAVVRWVEAGGTLVVADPVSPLTPAVAGPFEVFGLGESRVAPDVCDIDLLADLDRVETGGGVAYTVPGGARSCFGDGTDAFVVELDVGSGTIVAVGGQAPFTNGGLDEVDDAVLAADLLVADGSGNVAFLQPSAPGSGEDTLFDLVPDRVLLALVQLGLAFAVYVWFRARRVGLPVAEPQPTRLAGSELVAAVGELRQQERSPQRAATVLQDDLRRSLVRRLGVAPDARLDDVVAAAARGGADPDRLRAVLDPERVVGDGDALTILAREIDATRQEVLHDHH